MTTLRSHYAGQGTALLIALLLSATLGWTQSGDEPVYAYRYQDETVRLTPSSRLVALEENAPSLETAVERFGLTEDPLSQKAALRSQGLLLFRFPLVNDATESPWTRQVEDRMAALVDALPGRVRPVFEQGGAVLVPTDEVIVGFKAKRSLPRDQEYFAPVAASLGIETLRTFRGDAFILTVDEPSGVRSYAAARHLARLDEIAYAQPNHIVVRSDGVPGFEVASGLRAPAIETVAESGRRPRSPETMPFSTDSGAGAPVWTIIDALDFEGPFPPDGWSTGIDGGAAQATWWPTTYRAHDGARSAYCAAGGPAGVTAPGPAPANMGAVLRSPPYDLSGYEEVYVEAWFYTVNEIFPDPGGIVPRDYPLLLVCDAATNDCSARYLAIQAAGDCTRDPTTDNGWRKVLYRIPPAMRGAAAYLDFHFVSNGSVRTEGAYIDDVRIVGSAEVDSAQLGNDPYGGRQYELRNVGQIAGLGSDANDLQLPEAWRAAPVSASVVVALIDSGVDADHPDLNLVQGYDHDGTPGGVPKSAADNHGTACAGNAGAVFNNRQGVIGTAPGVKIMSIHGGSTQADLAAAIDVAVAQGVHVLSNSWGWVGAPSTAIETAIDDALAAGRVVVFAAGNGPDRPPWTYEVAFPGHLTGTKDIITVGASSPTDEHKSAASSDGEFAWGSSYLGSGPDVLAPGPWSYTTDRLGEAGYNDGSQLSDPEYLPAFGGTSSATPKVAGVAALMLSVNPRLTPAQVKFILRATADDIPPAGEDDRTGMGRVNAYQAVRLARQMAGGAGSLPAGAVQMLLLD